MMVRSKGRFGGGVGKGHKPRGKHPVNCRDIVPSEFTEREEGWNPCERRVGCWGCKVGAREPELGPA